MMRRLLIALACAATLSAQPAVARQAGAPASASVAASASASASAGASAPVASTPVASAPVMPGVQVSSAPQTVPGVGVGGAAGSLLQTIVALCLVLALFVGLAWLVKRFGPRQQGAGSRLRIVEAINLGGRERIMLLEVDQQWIVVGASPGRLTTLASMPKPLNARTDAELDGESLALQPSANFAEWLKQMIDKRNAK